MFPARYELGFYITEDCILLSGGFRWVSQTRAATDYVRQVSEGHCSDDREVHIYVAIYSHDISGRCQKATAQMTGRCTYTWQSIRTTMIIKGSNRLCPAGVRRPLFR
jgi:hypothetical protein